MTTFYIVRHGESEWNTKRIVQGQKDSPLTEKGQKQAGELANKLAGVKFDQVFSSDLIRAKKTAEILSLQHKMAVRTTKLLREQSFGDFEGNDLDLLLGLFDEWKKLSDKEKFSHRPHQSIETDEETVARFLTFIRETAIAYAGKTILIVTHGLLMRNLMIHLGEMTYADEKFFDNSGFIRLESDGVDFFVQGMEGLE